MKEKQPFKMNGLAALAAFFILLVAGIGALVFANLLGAALLVVAFVLVLPGFALIQPNQAKVLTLFGKYIGTIEEAGFWYVNPFSGKNSISLRTRNFQSEKLKVNDLDGNPIEIAAVIVYKVNAPAKAVFDVEDYQRFVGVQSETGIRHIASKYPYDNHGAEGHSLRANADEIAEELKSDLQKRLEIAGVEVIEARLMHLAYSQEIASTMLQRQQAAAVLAARQIIVEGAVSMVQMAIQKLKDEGVVDLDEEKKAIMINNLMVAIVSERSAQPVINAGSIY